MYILHIRLLDIIHMKKGQPLDSAAEVFEDGILFYAALFVEFRGQDEFFSHKAVERALVGKRQFMCAKILAAALQKLCLSHQPEVEIHNSRIAVSAIDPKFPHKVERCGKLISVKINIQNRRKVGTAHDVRVEIEHAVG